MVRIPVYAEPGLPRRHCVARGFRWHLPGTLLAALCLRGVVTRVWNSERGVAEGRGGGQTMRKREAIRGRMGVEREGAGGEEMDDKAGKGCAHMNDKGAKQRGGKETRDRVLDCLSAGMVTAYARAHTGEQATQMNSSS